MKRRLLALLAAGVMLLCGMPAAGAEASAPLTEGAAPSAGPIAGPAAVVLAGRDAPAPGSEPGRIAEGLGLEADRTPMAAYKGRTGCWPKPARHLAASETPQSKQEVTLDELSVAVTVPSDWYAVTRDTPEDDPVWKAMEPYGWEYGAMRDFMRRKNHSYLHAVNQSRTYEIVVSVRDWSSYEDWRHLEQYDLAQVEEDVDRLFPTNGYLHGAPYFYRQKSGGARFLCLELDAIGFPLYTNAQQDTLLYTTVYHRRELDVALFPLDGSISDEDEAELQAFIEGIRFLPTGLLQAKADPDAMRDAAETPYDYTDPTTGSTFTVPAGWAQYKRAPGVTLKLGTGDAGRPVVLFECRDLYTEWGEWENVSEPRESFFDGDSLMVQLARTEEVAEGDVSERTYGGAAYYEIEQSWLGNTAEGFVTSPMTSLFHFENGYRFGFHFIGEKDTPEYEAFLGMVESASYLTPETLPNHGHQRRTALLAGLALAVLAGPMPVWAYRKKRKWAVSRRGARRFLIGYGVFTVCILTALGLFGCGWFALLPLPLCVLWGCLDYQILISAQPVPAAVPWAPPGPAYMPGPGQAPQPMRESACLCPQCGGALQPGEDFCRQCGAPKQR